MASIRLTLGADGHIDAAGILSWSRGYRVGQEGDATDGIHAGWQFTGGRFTLHNDRYGIHPLFYWQQDRRCAIATSIRELLELGAPTELDYDALAVFLRLGFHLGDDTPFRAIRAVPPNASFQPREAAYLKGERPQIKPTEIRRDDAIDAFITVFHRALLQRVACEPFVLPLSGGRDSRHILLGLRHLGIHPKECVTVEHFEPRGQADRDVARVLSHRCGIPHRTLRQRHRWLAAERRKNVRTFNCTDEHVQFLVLADYLAGHTSETYDGIAGDVLTQSSYLTPRLHRSFEDEDWEAVAALVLEGQGRTVTDRALLQVVAPPLARKLGRDRAVARIVREAKRHQGSANPVASFYFWNRTRREIALAPYALMTPAIAYAPFLDRHVFDLLMATPTRMPCDRTFHTDAIARAYPQFRDIPYAREDRPVARRWRQRQRAAGLVVESWRARAWISLKGVMPGLLAVLVDGRDGHLWPAPTIVGLAQLRELIADTSRSRDRADQFASSTTSRRITPTDCGHET